MYQPVLSIDVAKGKSVAAAFLSSNHLFRKPFSFHHSPFGMENLLSLLAEMESISGTKPPSFLRPPATGSAILAEIGDIKRFPGSKQLSAFAGLDASVFESGTFTASRNRISKRGSSYLRTALYQATVAAVSQQRKGPRNPTLSRYYQQKLAEGKPQKVALVATCHKLLRIIFGVWSSNSPFAVQ